MKPSIEGMLIDFVNHTVWEGMMNTFDDREKYGKGHHKDNSCNLMIALNRCKNKGLHMEETKNPIQMSPECERLGLSVVGMKMTLGFNRWQVQCSSVLFCSEQMKS